MKVRCYDNSYLEDCLTVGRIYDVKEIKENYYVIKDDKGITNLFWHGDFEIVKENEMEKTFREVIADIKVGEVWENIDKSHWNLKEINCFDNDGRKGIRIVFKEETDYYTFIDNENLKFKLKRKQYTFEEAFKAYEEGKEIESCEVLTGCYPSKYKRIANEDAQWREGSYSWDKRKYIGIPFYEVRGKWYINN
jgi:hypothetical protein